MITAFATVISNEDGYVIASCQKASSCKGCAAKQNCGLSTVNNAIRKKTVTIEVPCEKPIAIGSLIEIGMQENVLLQSAVYIYLLPLLFFILAALSASMLNLHEAMVIVASFVSSVFGFYLARVKTAKLEAKSESKPTLLRIV